MNIGWYKKGKAYRFVYGIDRGFIYYQVKSKFGSKEMMAVNQDFDSWFNKADYVGLKYEEMGLEENAE